MSLHLLGSPVEITTGNSSSSLQRASRGSPVANRTPMRVVSHAPNADDSGDQVRVRRLPSLGLRRWQNRVPCLRQAFGPRTFADDRRIMKVEDFLAQ